MTLPMTPGTTAWVHLDTLKAWGKNPRNITAAIGPVSESIKRFGFVAPVVVWKEGARMVAGHTRLAALRLILSEEPTFVPRGAPPGVLPGMLPVRFHSFASESEADAYAIADNRLNEIAEWDTVALEGLLSGLGTPLVELAGFDLSALTLPELSAPEEAPSPAAAAPIAAPAPGGPPAAPAGAVPAGDPASEWAGMPEYSSEEHKPFKSVTVHFRCEADFEAFCALVPGARARFMWFPAEVPGEPERTIGSFAARRYVSGPS